jgi:large subunit ribosomal protein L25
MAHVQLQAQERSEFGNGPARRLRRQGLVPGIVYQNGGPSVPLAIPERELRRALAEGRTSVIDLAVGTGAASPVLVKDWQLDPVRGDVLHVDFTPVDLTQEVEAPVGVALVGTSVGVRDGGVLDQPHREVVVSALPDSLPDHLELDVSDLAIGDSLTVGDIVAPPGVVIVDAPEIVVASVVAPSAVIAEAAEEAEAVEGEAPAEAAAPSEPEGAGDSGE